MPAAPPVDGDHRSPRTTRSTTSARSPPPAWDAARDYGDIRYEVAEGIAKLTICRPEVRNAFRPQTLVRAVRGLRRRPGRSRRRGGRSSPARAPTPSARAGDQKIRGDDGYLGDDAVRPAGHRPAQRARPAGPDPAAAQAGRGHGRRVRHRRRPHPPPGLRPDHRRRQRPLRPDRAPGRQLRRRLRRRPAGPRRSGSKRAKEMWFLCRQYDGGTRPRDGDWSTPWCRSTGSRPRRWPGAGRCSPLSPLALRMLKAGFNAAEDGLAGHPATRRGRDDALLHDRGGPGGPERLRRAPAARLRPLPAPARERPGAPGP